MNSRVAPPTSQRLEAEEAADAVLLVDDEVARLEVAEVGQEPPQPAPLAPRVEVHLLREDVPVGEDRERGLGDLEAAGEDADPGQDARALADREAVLAEHVGEAVGAAGVPEEHDGGGGRGRGGPRRGGARRRRRWAPAGRRRGRRRLAASTSRTSTRGVAERRASRAARETRASSGSGESPSARRFWSSTARDQKPRASSRTASGSMTATGPGREVRPRRHGRPGHEGHELGEPLGREPALERLEEGGELAPPREALGQDRGQRRQHGARREDVGEGQRDEGLDRPGGALRVGVEAAQALHGVAEELDAHRLRAVGGEDVEDAAAPGHLARGGDRVLPRVAPLVERLEQDLGRHLVAHAQAHDARLEEVRGEARPEEARRRGDEGAGRAGPGGEPPPGGPRRRRGGAGRGRAAAPAREARARRPRGPPRRRGSAGPAPSPPRRAREAPPRGGGARRGGAGRGRGAGPTRPDSATRPEAARVLRASASAPSSTSGASQPGAGALTAGGCGPRSRRWSGRARGRPARARPPAASTSARPTTWSAAQSAPFTRTSGRRARIASIGVGSS